MIELPKKLDRYTLIHRINKGGMAEIYEGTRDSIKGVAPKVAIKIMDPKKSSDETFRKLFAHEAIVSSNLRHKNLIHVQDFHECDGYHYIVMEFVDGLTLRDIIRRCSRHKITLPAPLVAEIGRQMCEGLHYAHMARTPEGKEIGLVHRDIKPSNIMLDKAGVVKVVDFGVSVGDEMKDLKPGFRGTWGYMSVEQAQKKRVTAQSDLFSAGLLLFELCTHTPFFADQKKEIQSLTQESIDGRLQDLGPDHFVLREILSKAMHVDLHQRFKTAKEMSEMLDGKSHNMVQARQDLVALYQSVVQKKPGKMTRQASSSNQKSMVGFFIVLLLPVLVILVLYVLNQLFFDPKTDTEPASLTTVSVSKTMPKKTKTKEKKETQYRQEDIVKTKKESPKNTTKNPTRKKVVPSSKTKISTLTNSKKSVLKVDPSIAYGLLTISADDSADVYVDGKKVRTVPLVDYKIPQGKHHVVIAKSINERQKIDLVIENGYSYIYVWSFFNKQWTRKQKIIISK